MKKNLILLMVFVLLISSLVACKGSTDTSNNASETAAEKKPIVGISMPTKEQPIWTSQGNSLVEILQAQGYETILEYAEDDTSKQLLQLENMITKGAKYLIIAAVDGYALSDLCDKAAQDGVKIIASDRLIMNTENVDYYLTFDLVRLGEIQGEYIEEKLDLKSQDGPFNIEIFSGSPDDPNSAHFYDGAMKVLRPYIESEKLKVLSGQDSLAVTGILKWDSSVAQSRMDNILSAYYSNAKLDAVLVANDGLAMGVISSLSSVGYGNKDGYPFPIITGQDCEITAIKYIQEGKQSMSVFLDAKILADKMVLLLNDIEAGKTIKADAEYNNDTIEVPTLLYDPVLIDQSNVNILVERGFYTKDELD